MAVMLLSIAGISQSGDGTAQAVERGTHTEIRSSR